MDRGLTNVILGFAGGIATGLLAGILIAPDKGFKTRRNISKSVRSSRRDFAQSMKDKVDELKYEVNEMVDEMQKKLSEAEILMRQKAKQADKNSVKAKKMKVK